MSRIRPDFAGASWRPSPNFGPRRHGLGPRMIILHYTGMVSAAAALRRLCDPEAEVSAHYLVNEDGSAVQMVREADRAWHAGRGHWAGIDDVNSASIGIEIANPGHEFGYPDYPDEQIEAVIRLCRDIVSRHRIAPADILAHSDVAPARKIDPGEKFPWPRLAAAGLGRWVPRAERDAGSAALPPAERVQTLLRRLGYGVAVSGAFDAETKTVLAAFQRHHRPWRVDGEVDGETIERLVRLLALDTPAAGDPA